MPATPTTTRRPSDDRPGTAGRRSRSAVSARNGGRHLLICCSEGLYCHLSAVINADRSVLLDLDRKAACTECVMIGADVRPNWSEGPLECDGARWG